MVRGTVRQNEAEPGTGASTPVEGLPNRKEVSPGARQAAPDNVQHRLPAWLRIPVPMCMEQALLAEGRWVEDRKRHQTARPAAASPIDCLMFIEIDESLRSMYDVASAQKQAPHC